MTSPLLHLTTPPNVSVLFPVYNAERYLRAAVDSILTQTHEDFELLALDDGSTDRSLSILREYAINDSRVRIRSRENRGLVATLNELITASRGRYLARMDADDICRPRRFEKQIAYLEAHSECVAVGSRVLIIDPEGMPICEFITDLTHEEIDSAHLSNVGNARICHPTVVMRREAVLKVGGYRGEAEFAEDIDLYLRIAEIGRLANLPEVLLEYRRHLMAIGYAHMEQQRKNKTEIVKMARKRRGMVVTAELSESMFKLQTSADIHRLWAWWALSGGHPATARKHALRAISKKPFSVENIRVMACAIRGY